MIRYQDVLPEFFTFWYEMCGKRLGGVGFEDYFVDRLEDVVRLSFRNVGPPYILTTAERMHMKIGTVTDICDLLSASEEEPHP